MRLASARLSGELLSTRGYTQETIVVYTCNFGRYESVKPPVVVEPDIRYILFTDDPSLRSDVWEIRILESETGNPRRESRRDRKSTRLNSSHVASSYAVFCLKK